MPTRKPKPNKILPPVEPPLTLNPLRMRILNASTPDDLPTLALAEWPAAVGLESMDQLQRILARTAWTIDIKHHCLAAYHHGPWASARRIWLRGTARLLSPSTGLPVTRRWVSIALAMVNARHSGPDSHYAYAIAAAKARLAEIRAATSPAEVLALLQAPLRPREMHN